MPIINQQNKFMRAAINQAKKSLISDDVPVGCVIVHEDKIIARACNRRIRDNCTTSHCELLCIKKACKALGDWRLEGCTMYVTLEPCPMCAGAILQARFDKVVIGAMNNKAGCCGSVVNILDMEGFNHKVEVVTGVLAEENSTMISSFFNSIREKKRLESNE